MKKTDIKDERFGMLTAIEPTDGRDFGNVIWKCKCDCGKIVYKSTNYLNKDRVTAAAVTQKCSTRNGASISPISVLAALWR